MHPRLLGERPDPGCDQMTREESLFFIIIVLCTDMLTRMIWLKRNSLSDALYSEGVFTK